MTKLPGARKADCRPSAPTAREIESRLRGPLVTTLRPVVRGGTRVLGLWRGFRFHASGLDQLGATDEPFIIAANHSSHVDTAAILATLPRRARQRTCVAAALDVFGSPADGGKVSAVRRECLQVIVAAGFHAFAFDRQGPPRRSLRAAADLVSSGWNLLLYPEGTRSRTGELGEFKSGVAILARVTGRPVVPVNVSGGADVLPCGSTLPRRGRIQVRFGAPMTLAPGERAAEFTSRVRQHVWALATPGTAPLGTAHTGLAEPKIALPTTGQGAPTPAASGVAAAAEPATAFVGMRARNTGPSNV